MKKVGSMSKKKDDDEEDEENKKGDYKSVKKEDFIFPDLKTGYMYSRFFLPENTYKEYISKRNCVDVGCCLLYKKMINTKDEKKKEEYNDLILRGEEALETAIPSKRTINFLFQDFAGKKYTVYKMTANDAGESHSREDEYNEAKKGFRDQQYQHCIKKLQKIDHEIQKKLVENDIISGDEPPLDELMVKLMRMRFQKKLDEYEGRIKEDAVSS